MIMHVSSLRVFTISLAVAAVIGLSATSPEAAPAKALWSLHTLTLPTSFSSADNPFCELEIEREPFMGTGSNKCDRYVLVASNQGGIPSSGVVVVKGVLPKGIVLAGTPFEGPANESTPWNCSGSAGASVFTCETESAVPALTPADSIVVPILVGLGAQAEPVGHFEVSGGGAPSASADTPTTLGAGPQPFGVLASSFTATAIDSAGSVDSRAAAHPDGLTTAFAFPSATSINELARKGVHPVEDGVRQIVTDLPAGVVGDALVTPTCSATSVSSFGFDRGACPPASRVGNLTLFTPEADANTELAIFNVTPDHGYPAEFGFYEPTFKRALFLYATVVGTGANAHVRVITPPLPRVPETVENMGSVVTFFGDPAVRDGQSLASGAFFTNPSDCNAPGFTTTIHVDSWDHPGRTLPDGEPDFSDTANWKSAETVSPPVTGCEQLTFRPTIDVQPTTTAPDAPTGLNVELRIAQNEDPNGLATPPLKDATVTLPRGLAISPSSASGLQGCSDEQIALSTNVPATCPAASQIATVSVHTPILKETLTGQLFLGDPECSPCSNADAQNGRLARLFIQVHSDQYGITLKMPGSASIDPNSGQITATFKNNPQQPFDDLKVQFPESPRASLATPMGHTPTPSGCGTYTTTSDLLPWSSPATPDATPSSSFNLASCASNAFAPSFTAGTSNPQAAAYSPFQLTFSRNDGEQFANDIEQTLPPGLLAKIAGVQLCGSTEASAASCPAGSRIGTVTVGAGPGPNPFYTTGSIYLTGPYNGAPFGEVVIVQAIAGPFNLGTVIVHGAIHFNPATAQPTVTSDPFPSILDGIPLQIRTVNVNLNREGFTLNPTSCNPNAVTGRLLSTEGTSTAVSSPFQVTNCAQLAFKPTLTASTQAKTSKTNGASLHVQIAATPGQANIAKVKIDLPLQLPSRLSTLQKACLASIFAANPATCPPASLVGTASVISPLVTNPLTGPIYLVSHGGAAFPDTVIVLQGEGLTFELDGKTNIKKGITSSYFESAPDAPFNTLNVSLPEGPHSILAAYGNLCTKPLTMPTLITAQNNATIKQTTHITTTNCPKTKKHTNTHKTSQHTHNKKH